MQATCRRAMAIPAFERLGATRDIAVTWGKIADIAHLCGDHDQATELHRRRLEVYRKLVDPEGIANASWGLAKIDLAREDYEAAFPRVIESSQIMSRLRRPEGIAAVGGTLGQLLVVAGHPDQARQVLSETQAAAITMGWIDVARRAGDLADQLPPSEGEE
jgi:hypothetical protein